MIKNLGVQLYTVRDYFKDEEFTDLTFKKIAEAGYTEAHGAGAFGMDPKSFGALAKKHGIKIIGNHHRYDFIMEKPQKIGVTYFQCVNDCGRAWRDSSVIRK